MSLIIGPITIKDVENLKWSTRRQNDIISIPYGSQVNNVAGVELIEYQMSGTIFSDTVAPKLLRRQLTELFENSSRDFTYIEFSEDTEELSGWFLLDSFSTAIIPATFHYDFDMTVRRLSLDNSQMVALYAQDDTPLVSDYSLTPATRRWVAMPNGQGDSSHLLRTGDEGTTRVPIDSAVHYMPYTQTSVINDFRCRVYDTTVRRSLADFANSTNHTESGWEERYGLGNNFEGDIVISNGLIRLVYIRSLSSGFGDGRGPYHLHIWSGTKWEWASVDFLPAFNSAVESVLSFGPPTITSLTNDKIEFTQYFTNTRTLSTAQAFYGVRNTLHYGSYYIAKELIVKYNPLNAVRSFIPTQGRPPTYTIIGSTHSVTTDNYSSIQLQSTTGFNYNVGFLHTRIPTPVVVGYDLQLGYTASVNTRFEVGVFVLPNPPSASTTLANIGREYLSNSTQKRVLINPKWI